MEVESSFLLMICKSQSDQNIKGINILNIHVRDITFIMLLSTMTLVDGLEAMSCAPVKSRMGRETEAEAEEEEDERRGAAAPRHDRNPMQPEVRPVRGNSLE